jgi:hypothetical protein
MSFGTSRKINEKLNEIGEHHSKHPRNPNNMW